MRSALKSLALGAVAALVAASAMAQTTITYTNSTPSPIPDVATMTSSISVPSGDWGGMEVRDIDIAINLFHTWDSDLTVFLTGPDGTVVRLWAGVGGSSDGFNVTIDDEATTNINAITGTFRPQQYPSEAMCEYDKKDPSGTYTLTIQDTVGGDSGTLNSWSLVITGNDDRNRDECVASGGDTRVRRGGRGLGSSANNGGGNGDDLAPPGQHGR